MIRKFDKYFEQNKNDYDNVINELKNLINKTIEASGGEFSQFVESFIKEPEEYEINGLINDSDINDFYLKYKNEIDQILNDTNFYSKTAEDLGIFSLYDYILVGTMKAVEEFLKMI